MLEDLMFAADVAWAAAASGRRLQQHTLQQSAGQPEVGVQVNILRHSRGGGQGRRTKS